MIGLKYMIKKRFCGANRLRAMLLMLVCAFFYTCSSVAAADARQAAGGVIRRLVPEQADSFVLETIPAEDGKDVFEIESRDGQIVLRGNNGVSLSSALRWYLKYYGNSHVSWCGDQLDLPDPLPVVPKKVRIVSPHEYRYAFNYCTFGYAMAFWDWARWERELDFMAMQGINTFLAATGAEVVYRNVYRDLGLSEQDVDDFIAAPPYLPWFLMTNLDGFGGPNSEAWYDSQELLQKKITTRARKLGIKPVLHAFGGHVPAALKKVYPEAEINRLRGWNGFPGVYVLDPADPLFQEIGSRFIRENIRLYGTDHLYAADTFNEVHPPSDNPAYFKGISAAVYESMAEADPKAHWVMMGWLFLDRFWTQPRIEALLSGAPEERMLLLEFFPDSKPVWSRTDAYAGKPWICGIINNWGGKQGMYGRMDWVGEELPKLLDNPAAGKLAGIGTLNEGNTINPIVFEQMYEMGWRDEAMDLDAWVRDYAHARYGEDHPDARKAWKILLDTLYKCEDKRHGPQGSFLSMPPSLSPGGGGFARASIFYDTTRVREAFRYLLAAAEDLGQQETYRFDLVDLGRQVMSDLSQQKLHAALRRALANKDAAAFDRAAEAFYEAIRDTDALLQTEHRFQLGHYLKYPRNAGASEAENARHERNARRLITRWGKTGHLNGYAQRQYGGLLADFNLRCWKIYLGQASEDLHAGRDFDASAARRAVNQYVEDWIDQRNKYPSQARGDAVAVATKIWDKYCAECDTVSPDDPVIGRWEYKAEGRRYVREFGRDGSLNLSSNGRSHSGWDGYRWYRKGDIVICRKSNGGEFGRHKLRDDQTLLFLDEPWGPATRVDSNASFDD